MTVRIEDITRPIGGIDPLSKMVILENDGLVSKVLVTIPRRRPNTNGRIDVTNTPIKALHECNLAIGVDLMVRNFSIIKNRFGCDNTTVESKEFLNNTLWVLSRSLLRSVSFIYSEYDVTVTMMEIIRTICMVTGETIYQVDGKFMTERDMYLDKNKLIKHKVYKHKFVT